MSVTGVETATATIRAGDVTTATAGGVGATAHVTATDRETATAEIADPDHAVGTATALRVDPGANNRCH